MLLSSCSQELRITTADINWKYNAGMGSFLHYLYKDTIIYSTVWDTVGYLSTEGHIIRKKYDSVYRKKENAPYHHKTVMSNTLILNDTCCSGSVIAHLYEIDKYRKSLDLSNVIGICSGGITSEELTHCITLIELRGGKKIKIIWDNHGDIGLNYVTMRPYKDKLILEYEMNEARYIALVDLRTFFKAHHIEYDWSKFFPNTTL